MRNERHVAWSLDSCDTVNLNKEYNLLILSKVSFVEFTILFQNFIIGHVKKSKIIQQGQELELYFFPIINIDIFIDTKEIIMVVYEPNENTYKESFVIEGWNKFFL